SRASAAGRYGICEGRTPFVRPAAHVREETVAINKRKVLDSARRQAQKGAKQKALKEYTRLIAADPRDAKLLLEMGDVYRRWGKVEEAVAQYAKVASQYREEGFDARAVAVLKQILALDPKGYSARVELAELYQRMGLDSDALVAFQAAADGYYKEGRRREAVELLRRMVSLDPGNTTSRIKVAELLWQEGLVDDAASEFKAAADELVRQGASEEVVSVRERVLEMVPDDVETLRALACDFVESGECERARPLAMRALKLEREADHFELLCRIYKELGEDDQLADLTRELADYYRGRGEEPRAREAMQRLPSESVRDGATVGSSAMEESEMAEPCGSDGDGERVAVEDSDDGIHEDDSAQPVQATAIQQLADEEFILDAGEEKKVVTEEPPPPTHETDWVPNESEAPDLEQRLAEARVYIRYGKHEEAMDCLSELAQSDPGQPTVWQQLARVHVECGDNDEAGEALQKALSLSVDLALPDLMAEIEAELVALSKEQTAPSSDSLAEPELLRTAMHGNSVADGPIENSEESKEAALDSTEIEFEIELEDTGQGTPPADSDLLLADSESNEPDLTGEALAEADIEIEIAPEAATADSEVEAVEEPITSGWEACMVERKGEDDADQEALDAASQSMIRNPVIHETATRPGESADEESAAGDAEPTVSDDLAAILAEVGSPGADVEAAESSPALSDAAMESHADEGEEDEDPLELEDVDSGPWKEAFDEADFDLAAELAGVFEEVEKGETSRCEAFGDSTLGEGMRSVFMHFKRGVSHTLAESDMETRFDLAIAYREMGLFEDAAMEFQVCLSFPTRRLESLHMLGLCVLELGRPQEAADHIEQALSTPELSPQQEAALRFDLGRIRIALGDTERAQECFQAAQRIDPAFPGLAEAMGEAAQSVSVDEPAEGYESFEDLFDSSGDEGPTQGSSDRSAEGTPPPGPITSQPAESGGITSRPGRRKKISFV
ncbi:MAG: tetratricopeptide repeat protein, partial [Myxococcota bacterium]